MLRHSQCIWRKSNVLFSAIPVRGMSCKSTGSSVTGEDGKERQNSGKKDDVISDFKKKISYGPSLGEFVKSGVSLGAPIPGGCITKIEESPDGR